jgi:hypothetical protein
MNVLHKRNVRQVGHLPEDISRWTVRKIQNGGTEKNYDKTSENSRYPEQKQNLLLPDYDFGDVNITQISSTVGLSIKRHC